jgi:hypothetical protein
MKKLKYLLPLLLAIITIAIYNPIQLKASNTQDITVTLVSGRWNVTLGTTISSSQDSDRQRSPDKYSLTNVESITYDASLPGEPYLVFYDINDVIVGVFVGDNNLPAIPPSNAVSFSWYGSITSNRIVPSTMTLNLEPTPAQPTAPTIDFSSQSLIASYIISNDLNPDPDWFRYKLDVTFTQPLAVIIRTKAGVNDYSAAPDYSTIKTTHTFFIESKISATGHDKLEIFVDNIHSGDVPQTGWQGDYSWNPSAGQDAQAQATVEYTFQNHLGTVIETVTILIYDAPNQSVNSSLIPAVPPREGFTVVGWSVDLDAPATEDLIVTPVYQAVQTYDVTFLDWDNSSIGVVTVQQGQTAIPPYIPTRFGYTFSSWLPPVANIQGDITTVAQYTPNQYMVTWISDGITIKSQLENHDSVFQTLAPPVTKENHVLTGWNFQGTTTPLQLDGTLIGASSFEAVWEPVPTFTVVWRDVDFSTLKIEYVIESGIAVAPNYVASSGFVLVGWTPDPTQPISQNITFVAVVEALPTPPPTFTPQNATSITDLFAGVFGAIIGSIMILGTIDLFGIELSSLLWLFIAGTGFMMIFKLVR